MKRITVPAQPWLRTFSRRAESGSTLAEALVGIVIASTGIAGLCVADADCLGIARAHKEFLVANQCLQQRVEQFRAANWSQVTDASQVSAILQSQTPVNNGYLNTQTEKITVNAYPPVTPPVAAIVVTRDGSGTVSIASQPSGFSLRSTVAVKIDFQEAWNSAQGERTRVRESSTVVALGGLAH